MASERCLPKRAKGVGGPGSGSAGASLIRLEVVEGGGQGGAVRQRPWPPFQRKYFAHQASSSRVSSLEWGRWSSARLQVDQQDPITWYERQVSVPFLFVGIGSFAALDFSRACTKVVPLSLNRCRAVSYCVLATRVRVVPVATVGCVMALTAVGVVLTVAASGLN